MKDKIYFRASRKRWVVEVTQRDGRRDYVGSFRTREEADAAMAIAQQAKQTVKAMTRPAGADLEGDEALKSEPIVLHLHGGGDFVIDRVSKMVVANSRFMANTEVEARVPDYESHRSGTAGKRMTIMSLPRVRFLEGPDPLAGDGPTH